MKCETFVQFLQEFWVRHSYKNYRAVINLLVENDDWVRWAHYYVANYINWGERPEAPFEGAYSIETITEAWVIIEPLLIAYIEGYNDGVNTKYADQRWRI